MWWNLNSNSLSAIASKMILFLSILLWNFSFANITIGGRDNIIQLINKQYNDNITRSDKNFIIEVARNPVRLSNEQKNDLNKELLALKVSTGINFYVLIPNPYAPTSDDSNDDIFIKLSSCTVNAVHKSQLNDPGSLSVLLNIDCYLIASNSKAVQFRPTMASNSSKDQVLSVLAQTFQKLKQTANFKDPKNATRQYVIEIISALRKIYTNAPPSEALSGIAAKAKNCDRSVDDFPFQFVLDGDLKKLTAEQRIDLIKCLDDVPSTGEDEKIIIRILSTTPNSQQQYLLEKLLSANVYSDRLISAIDGDEFIDLVNTLCGWLEPPDQSKWEESSSSSKVIFFDEFDGMTFSFNKNGQMEFKTRKNFSIKWNQEVVVSPYEYVTVAFASDFFFAGHPFRAGDIITVPGLFVWAIFNEGLNKQIKLTANVALNIPLFFVGAGEINALKNAVQISRAIRAIRYANASASIIAASGGLAMAAGLEDELNLTKEGQDVLKYWIWFNLTYAGVNLSYAAVNAGKSLWIACEKAEKANPSAASATTIKNWKLSLKNIFSRHGKNIDEIDEVISSVDELKIFLSTVDESTTVMQLEQRGVKSFFRGTTRKKSDNTLYSGNPNSIEHGISTSTDPVVATIFATESATLTSEFKGVLQIALPDELKNVVLSPPNRRPFELEVIFKTSADDFSNLSKIEISIEDARKLVKEIFNIDIPSKIYSQELNNSRYLLENLPKSSLEKSFEFYQKAIKYNIKAQ